MRISTYIIPISYFFFNTRQTGIIHLPHPLYPPLLQRRGGKILKRGANAPLRRPASLISFERVGGKILKRGANAPLRHPASLISFKGVGGKILKRGANAPLRRPVSLISFKGVGGKILIRGANAPIKLSLINSHYKHFAQVVYQSIFPHPLRLMSQALMGGRVGGWEQQH